MKWLYGLAATKLSRRVKLYVITYTLNAGNWYIFYMKCLSSGVCSLM